MSRWKVNPRTLFVLGSLIIIMLLIVVLPDVDLPDFTFHQGTAPLVVHARANAAPPVVAVAAVFQLAESDQSWYPDRDRELVSSNLDPNFRPILLRSIRR